jgi:hypothetical protein
LKERDPVRRRYDDDDDDDDDDDIKWILNRVGGCVLDSSG